VRIKLVVIAVIVTVVVTVAIVVSLRSLLVRTNK
jgi:hypothetical protein